MHDKPKGRGADGRASTATQDLRDQGVVLMVVLANHPAQLRLRDLIGEVGSEHPDFRERDRIKRAVRDLVAGDPLYRSGDMVLCRRRPACASTRSPRGGSSDERANGGRGARSVPRTVQGESDPSPPRDRAKSGNAGSRDGSAPDRDQQTGARRTHPRLDTAVRLASALGVSVASSSSGSRGRRRLSEGRGASRPSQPDLNETRADETDPGREATKPEPEPRSKETSKKQGSNPGQEARDGPEKPAPRSPSRTITKLPKATHHDSRHTTNRVVPCPPSAVAVTSSHRPSVLGAAG
jgi:hypothetical protein